MFNRIIRNNNLNKTISQRNFVCCETSCGNIKCPFSKYITKIEPKKYIPIPKIPSKPYKKKITKSFDIFYKPNEFIRGNLYFRK